MFTSPQAHDFNADRERMVRDQLARRGVRDRRVLAAFRNTPRERFFPPDRQANAYDDAAFPVDCGQTISQPYMVAHMTERLALCGVERVLEIGTGTGYQTAILAQLAAGVFTIETHPELMEQARRRLDNLGLDNIEYRLGDGTLGWPDHAQYDGIIVTAGAPRVPPSLTAQLADGGRLVIPVGDEHEQTLMRVTRRGDSFDHDRGIACRFVKLIGAEGWPSG